MAIQALFSRCPYRLVIRDRWSFEAVPLDSGYADTSFEATENANGIKPVGAVRNIGFIFARLADGGIGFEDFFGDSLSSIDNMVDRSPEGTVAGPPLRYMHKCNWKMLVENQTDTCHPMVRIRVPPAPQCVSGKSSGTRTAPASDHRALHVAL